MVKIKEYRIQKQGLRGLTVTLPRVWVNDQRLKVGEKLAFYRDETDNLIIRPGKEEDRD